MNRVSGMNVSLDQRDPTFLQVYRLTVMAAPFREIWFGTAAGLTSGNWRAPTNTVSRGDLISDTGRAVKRNHELTRALGIVPVVPDLGLDAVDIRPRGEVVFSVEQGVWSESLGALQPGYMLSNRGRVVLRNSNFIQPFAPESPAPDVGLDAMHLHDHGYVVFRNLELTGAFAPFEDSQILAWMRCPW